MNLFVDYRLQARADKTGTRLGIAGRNPLERRRIQSIRMGRNVFRFFNLATLCVFAFHIAALRSDAAEALPSTQAETLTGHKLEFPAALLGTPTVCVFGFSKGAGDLTKVWMTRLSQEGINAWSVAELEKAPSLVRGMIRGSMRKGTPPSLLEHSLILAKDTDIWKRAVGANDESLPVVVVFDAGGQILWTYQGAFGDEPYSELKSRLAKAALR